MPYMLMNYDDLVEEIKEGNLNRGHRLKGSTTTFGDVCDLVGRHPNSIRANILFSAGQAISMRGAYVATDNIKILHDFFKTMRGFEEFEQVKIENDKLVLEVFYD